MFIGGSNEFAAGNVRDFFTKNLKNLHEASYVRRQYQGEYSSRKSVVFTQPVAWMKRSALNRRERF
jgi:hypothetical protein